MADANCEGVAGCLSMVFTLGFRVLGFRIWGFYLDSRIRLSGF